MTVATRNFLVYLCFACTIAAQGTFWYQTRDIEPDIGIVPDVPGEETVKALAFGDEQALFRYLAFGVQNAGDTYGRFTALYKYDYFKLYHWMRLLDSLDRTSNYLPSMATYYFGQTQRKSDVKYIYDYLLEHAIDRPEEKWWWLVQASYLANHKLDDKNKALRAAVPLKDTRGIPLWAQQTPAFIYEQQGEMKAALSIIEGIMASGEEVGQGELNFMQYFVNERLQRMEELTELFERRQQSLNDKAKMDEEAPAGEETSVPEAKISIE